MADINKLPYTKKTYWVSVVASFVVATIVNLILGLIVGSETARFVYFLLAVYWVLIEVRRFHDANKSGWLVLINLIPGIGTVAALIIAGVLKSDYCNNKWKQ